MLTTFKGNNLKIYNSSDGKKALSNKDILIFDFDGVLVDSVKIKTSAFANIYKDYGNEVQNKVIKHHLQNGGMSRYDKFKHYHHEFLGIDIDEESINNLSKFFSNEVVDKITSCKEIDGVSEMLSFAKSQDLICSIASATPETEVIEIVRQRGWSKFFNLVLGSPASKVNNIRSILNKTKSNRSQAIFFGDSPNDLSAARECDIDFIPINFLAGNNIGFRNLLQTLL